MRRNRPEDMWRRVKIGGPDACWPWLGGLTRVNGYGQITVCMRNLSTHRLAYELTHGPIPPGGVIRHRCDNPPCCNPAHLLLGTHAENSRDMAARGRSVHRPGSLHPLAKLTEAQALEIRRRRYSGDRVVDLAREFGVSPPTICRIAKNYGWTHVGQETAAA